MRRSRATSAERRHLFAYLAAASGLLVAYGLLRGSPWSSGVETHTLMEAIATLLAFVAGAMALVRFHSKPDDTFLFIGTGFLGTAFLDGYHAVVTSHHFASYFPSAPHSLIPWSWFASRLFLSAFLCLSCLAWHWRARLGDKGRVCEYHVYLIAGVLTAGSFLFFALLPLPAAYYPDKMLHRPEDLAPALLFLAALIGYLRKARWRHDAFEHWLILSLILNVAAQALFMTFSGQLFDLEFDAAHILKGLSYTCVLTGLLFSMHSIFRSSEERGEKIHKTSKILNSTIHNFPGGICVFDSELKLVAFNETFVDLLDLPRDMIKIGCRYEDLIRFNAERGEYGVGDIDGIVARKIEQARFFEPHCFEHVRPDGTTIEIHGTPMPEGGFIKTYLDITEKKRTEREIEKRDALLQGLVNTALDGIITIDAHGIITSFNPAAEKQFGYAAHEVMGRNVSLLMTDKDEVDHDSYVRSYIETGKKKIIGKDRTVMGKRADGSSFPLALSISEMIVSGERIFTGFIRDITEQREKEALLNRMVEDAHEAQSRIETQAMELAHQAESLAKARDEAMSAAAAKSDFLANMSHELRTPLNGMLGFTELIERETFGPIGHEKYAEFIKIIGESGRHLLTVINDILDYSKIEAGKLSLELAPFDLAQVTDGTVDLLAARAFDKGIELGCYIAPDVPTKLIGDSARLRQILINLVGNAIKFTESGGVMIEVSQDECGVDIAHLRFKIIDTGIGIKDDVQNRLFDKFSQADASTTRKYGGTGLGLAICKQLTEMMQGDIGVESHPGHGSTFWFTVQLARQATSDSRALAKIKTLLNGKRALVVEDNAINRDNYLKHLHMLGMNVVFAENQESVFPLLSSESADDGFELVIVGHLAQEKTGSSVSERLRIKAGKSTKLILSSSSGVVVTHGSAKEMGFDAVMPKPLHRTNFFGCLTYLYETALRKSGSDQAHGIDPPSRSTGLRLLVAEDNKINQLLLETMLRGAGYTVDIANNGCEAVEAMKRDFFDLVLMDIHMPEMNGYKATRAIRQIPGKAGETPILAVTAAVMREDREKCHQAGMNDFIPKPIDKRMLLEKISFWTGLARVNDETNDHTGDAPTTFVQPMEDHAAALDELLDLFDEESDDLREEPASPESSKKRA